MKKDIVRISPCSIPEMSKGRIFPTALIAPGPYIPNMPVFSVISDNATLLRSFWLTRLWARENTVSRSCGYVKIIYPSPTLPRRTAALPGPSVFPALDHIHLPSPGISLFSPRSLLTSTSLSEPLTVILPKLLRSNAALPCSSALPSAATSP